MVERIRGPRILAPTTDPDIIAARAAHQRAIEVNDRDSKDPVRGPILKQAKALHDTEMASQATTHDALHKEVHAFYTNFAERMNEIAPDEARRYRLYHILVGSTPPDAADLFDTADGEIENEIKKLVADYGVQV